jgi:aryl-alcohol dehydrogenase-like predicted oxidoreductase
MRFRNLGRCGLSVSLIGLGCNNFGGRIDLEASRKVVHKALDLGITLFDTADIYGDKGGSETCLGQILGDRRKNIVLATKFAMPMDAAGKLKGASRRYIMSAVEASLRRLKTDYIDLYQQHQEDPTTPIEETLRALDDLVHDGKVRYVGCSNFVSWRVVEAQWTARHYGLNTFVAVQDELSLLVRHHEKELIPAIQAYGMGFLPYFPLASGLLTGKYERNAPMPVGARLTVTQPLAERYMTASNWATIEELAKFCAARRRTMLELAISWLAAKSVVSSIIAGATKPEQLEQNVRAADWVLSANELAEIDHITGWSNT